MKHTGTELLKPGCFKCLILVGKDLTIFIIALDIDSMTKRRKKKRREGKGREGKGKQGKAKEYTEEVLPFTLSD